MTSLRDALSEQWGQVPEPPPMARRVLFDLLSLLGLGVTLVGLVRGDGPGDGLRGHRAGVPGPGRAGVGEGALGLLGIVLGIAANWLIFLWVIARLPREHVALRSAVRAALLGAVGFEVIKQVMTIYLGVVSELAERRGVRLVPRLCSCSPISCRASCCS